MFFNVQERTATSESYMKTTANQLSITRRDAQLDIIVCVKHVPETAEAELKIDSTGKAIEKSGLVYDINEWDDYALEEAGRIKEKRGGKGTAITVSAGGS